MLFAVVTFGVLFHNSAFELELSCSNRCEIFRKATMDVLNEFASYLNIKSRIKVDMKITSLDMIQASHSVVLGFAKPTQYVLLQNDNGSFLYPTALAKQLVSMNFKSDIYAEIVDLEGRWDFEGGEKDLKFVIAHELAHGLGFISTISTVNGISPDIVYGSLFSQELSFIFSKPTIFDYFVKCNSTRLSHIINEYQLCSKYNPSLSSALVKKEALEYVNKDTKSSLLSYLTTPNACLFSSPSITFPVHAAKDITELQTNVISHSLSTDTTLELMHPSGEAKFKNLNPIMKVLYELGYTSKNNTSHTLKSVRVIKSKCTRQIKLVKATSPITTKESPTQWLFSTLFYSLSISVLQYSPLHLYESYFMALKSMLTNK